MHKSEEKKKSTPKSKPPASGKKFPQGDKLKISGLFSKDRSFEDLQNAIEVTIRTHKKLKEKEQS